MQIAALKNVWAYSYTMWNGKEEQKEVEIIKTIIIRTLRGRSYTSKSIYSDMFDIDSNGGSCNIYVRHCKWFIRVDNEHHYNYFYYYFYDNSECSFVYSKYCNWTTFMRNIYNRWFDSLFKEEIQKKKRIIWLLIESLDVHQHAMENKKAY